MLFARIPVDLIAVLIAGSLVPILHDRSPEMDMRRTPRQNGESWLIHKEAHMGDDVDMLRCRALALSTQSNNGHHSTLREYVAYTFLCPSVVCTFSYLHHIYVYVILGVPSFTCQGSNF